MTDAMQRRGQALVEFALILPIMLLLIMGGLWIALFLLYRTELQHVAQETAIVVAFEDCNSATSTAAQVLGHAPQDIECRITGHIARVKLVEDWPQVMPFLPSSIVAEARAVVRPTLPAVPVPSP